MNGGTATYNERSWAIDLIGHLKLLAARNNRAIKDAGGEQTVKAEGEAFKAIWRKAAARLGNGKEGNTALYNAEKVSFFGGVMVNQESARNDA